MDGINDVGFWLWVDAHVTLNIRDESAVVKVHEVLLGNFIHFLEHIVRGNRSTAHEPKVRELGSLLTSVDDGVVLIISLEHNVVGVVLVGSAEESHIALGKVLSRAHGSARDAKALIEALIGRLTSVGNIEITSGRVELRILGSVACP